MPKALRYGVFELTLKGNSFACLIAVSTQGLHAVWAAPLAESLVASLHERLGDYTLVEDAKACEPVWKSVQAALTGKPFTLPKLAETGTAFEQRVWQALSEIPFGTTISYTELAQMTGKPKAVRAVANACGRNPVAIVIPCHRVLRSDGSLGGYYWGLEIKKALLAHESSIASACKPSLNSSLKAA